MRYNHPYLDHAYTKSNTLFLDHFSGTCKVPENVYKKFTQEAEKTFLHYIARGNRKAKKQGYRKCINIPLKKFAKHGCRDIIGNASFSIFVAPHFDIPSTVKYECNPFYLKFIDSYAFISHLERELLVPIRKIVLRSRITRLDITYDIPDTWLFNWVFWFTHTRLAPIVRTYLDLPYEMTFGSYYSNNTLNIYSKARHISNKEKLNLKKLDPSHNNTLLRCELRCRNNTICSNPAWKFSNISQFKLPFNRVYVVSRDMLLTSELPIEVQSAILTECVYYAQKRYPEHKRKIAQFFKNNSLVHVRRGKLQRDFNLEVEFLKRFFDLDS